jgi:hypothetical protein
VTKTKAFLSSNEDEKKSKAEPVFDGWSRYKIPHPDDPDGPGRPWTRATTVAKAISDQYALNQWLSRKTLEGAALAPNLLQGVDWANKEKVNALVETMRGVAGANDGATRGTKFHTLTEKHDKGDKPVPETDLDAKLLDGYTTALDLLGIGAVPAFIERTVVVPGLDAGGASVAGVAGTFDRVMQSKKTGKFYVFDVKTSGDLNNAKYSIPEWELQLAIYQQAKVFWDWESKKFYDLPKLEADRALVFNINRDTGEWAVFPIDLEAGRKSLDLALKIRSWRTGNRGIVATPIVSG